MTRKESFLAALTATRTVKQAAAVARVSRKTVYAWRATDTQFAARWQAILTTTQKETTMNTAPAHALRTPVQDGPTREAARPLEPGRPKEPKEPPVAIRMLLDGATIECSLPPRPEEGYRVFVSPGQAVDGLALANALDRARNAFDQLCATFKSWGPNRR